MAPSWYPGGRKMIALAIHMDTTEKKFSIVLAGRCIRQDLAGLVGGLWSL
jgi:hypothetical protein